MAAEWAAQPVLPDAAEVSLHVPLGRAKLTKPVHFCASFGCMLFARCVPARSDTSVFTCRVRSETPFSSATSGPSALKPHAQTQRKTVTPTTQRAAGTTLRESSVGGRRTYDACWRGCDASSRAHYVLKTRPLGPCELIERPKASRSDSTQDGYTTPERLEQPFVRAALEDGERAVPTLCCYLLPARLNSLMSWRACNYGKYRQEVDLPSPSEPAKR